MWFDAIMSKHMSHEVVFGGVTLITLQALPAFTAVLLSDTLSLLYLDVQFSFVHGRCLSSWCLYLLTWTLIQYFIAVKGSVDQSKGLFFKYYIEGSGIVLNLRAQGENGLFSLILSSFDPLQRIYPLGICAKSAEIRQQADQSNARRMFEKFR